MAKRKLGADEVTMDLTSMTDCVFLLIIFFMVTTVFKDAQRIEVELPIAKYSAGVKEKKLRIAINDKNEVDVNGKTTTAENLMADLMAAKNTISDQSEAQTVILKGDKKVKYHKIYEIMNILQFCGITKVMVATEKEYAHDQKKSN